MPTDNGNKVRVMLESPTVDGLSKVMPFIPLREAVEYGAGLYIRGVKMGVLLGSAFVAFVWCLTRWLL